MSAGDNFDTTQPGLEGYKTKRRAGAGSISQTYMSSGAYAAQGGKSDDNFGHPCNAGCGCKEVCEPNLTAMGDTGCLLPPELTIRVVQADSRDKARGAFGQTDGVDFKTYHLKYSNGTWRGRRCCKTGTDSAGNLIDFCDPCSITTHADGTKSDCIYSGREGSTREAPMGTPKAVVPADRSRGMASRANETFMGPMPGAPPHQTTATPGLPDPTAGAKDWIPQPRIGGGTDCLEDGSIVGYTKPYCHVEWDGGGFFYNEDSEIGETECADGSALSKSVAGDPYTMDTSNAAHIGRCHCIENCEAATDVAKSMDEVLVLDTKGRCEHPKNAKYGTPIDDHIEKYGKTKWFPAQCVQSIGAGGWRPAKNCEGVVPDHCQDSNGDYIRKADGHPKYGDEGSCLVENNTWVGSATPPHCEDSDGGTTNAASQAGCEKDNNIWETSKRVFDEIITDKYGCMSQGYCVSAAGVEVEGATDKKACEAPSIIWGASTTGNIWAYNTWTANWIRSEPFNNCCGGNFVGQNSGAHQPNLSNGGRMGGVSSRPGGQSDNICMTPYDEAILINPGRTAAQINIPCIASQGIGPPSSTGAGRGEGSFILVLRGCDFYGDCDPKGLGLDDPDRGGRITVLYIPLNQILNCSNLDLNASEIKTGYNDNIAVKASYSFEFANPQMDHYPQDKNAASPYLEQGFQKFTTANSPIYIYHESGQDFHIRPPGDHLLTGLNMQYGPFKATEYKQNLHKTHSQAAGDALGYVQCACLAGCFIDSGVTGSDPNGELTPVKLYTKAACEASGKCYDDATGDHLSQHTNRKACEESGTCKDDATGDPLALDKDECEASGACENSQTGDPLGQHTTKAACEDDDINDGLWVRDATFTRDAKWVRTSSQSWHSGCPQNFDAKHPVFETCPYGSVADWFDKDIIDPEYQYPLGRSVDSKGMSKPLSKLYKDTCNKRRAIVDKELRSAIKNWPGYGVDNWKGETAEKYIGRILYKHKCGFTTSYCQGHGGVDTSVLEEPAIVGDPSVYGRGNLAYWTDTGLYPENKLHGEVGIATIFTASHVVETCFGNEYSGKIEYASNTRPIVIKSKKHGLQSGDAVTVNNVLGNFSANTLTVAQHDEIHWDFKKSKVCDGSSCNDVVNPPGKCVTLPNDTSGQPKGPVALLMWLIDVVDEDNFALYDCNGDPSDGRVQYRASVWNKKTKKYDLRKGFGRDDPCPPVCGDAFPAQPDSVTPVTNWEVCPYTGFWESPTASDPSQLFGKTVGWRPGGFGFFKLDENIATAQDWYVDIAQTEVCPVCCDHFMPLELVATVKDAGTLILNARCGFNCEGDLEPEWKTGHIGPDGSDGVIGAGNCCRCMYGCTNPNTGEDMPCGCWKCSDRIRSYDGPKCRSGRNSSFKKARKGEKCGDDAADNCCSCECCPGDSKQKDKCAKEYPTLDDWAACGIKCGEEGSPTSLGELKCEKKPIFTCVPNPMNPGGNSNACYSKGTEALCNGVSGEACAWQLSREQEMFDPCLGFPNSRDKACEGKFMCISAAPNSTAQTCTSLSPAEGGAYWDDDAECLGVDMGGAGTACQDCSKAIVTGCDKYEYKERNDSCPGFPGALHVPMKWDGIKWISEWVPMGDVGTKQCQKFANSPAWGEGRTGPPFCIGDCNFCGDCNWFAFDKGDPLPSEIGDPPANKYHMQLVMGCGSAIEMGGQGLPTVDSYNHTILNMRMNIFACKLPIGGPGKYLQKCPGPWGTCGILGYNCGPRPPCTDCCDFGGPKDNPGTCEVPNMYGMDPAACLNLQGGQINGNGWRTFRKTPEVFEIYHVDMDTTGRGYDLLVGRQIGGRACGWKAGDNVSIGLADRTAAELGGRYFGSNNVGEFSEGADGVHGPGSMLPSSTDRLSASSAYPESTELVEDIEKPRLMPVDWDFQKDFSGSAKFTHTVEDPTEDNQPAYRTLTSDIPHMEVTRRVDSLIPEDVFDNVSIHGLGKLKIDGTANYPQWVEIKVKDATKLTSHNRALDRHLYRGTSRKEPWPYGPAPWPVPHQSEFHVPQDSVYHINANFPGPLNNLFRIGNRPTKSNMPFENYFVADEPLLQPVPEKPGFFELVDALDTLDQANSGESRLHHNEVEKVEEVDITLGGKTVVHIKVTTIHEHDLERGEKIWLDEIRANQGACRIDAAACIDGDGNNVTSSYPTKKKCHTCTLPNGDDVTGKFPSKIQCENAHGTLGTVWTGTWHSGMIQRRQLTPNLTMKVTEDVCLHKDFGICKTQSGILGKEIRSNLDEPDKKIGVITDDDGEETDAITNKAVCLAILKDEDDNNLSPVWTGPGSWEDSGVHVKGCVGMADASEVDSEDFEEPSSDPCNLCYVRCKMRNMFWDGDNACAARNCCGGADYCPSAAANGEWVIDNVTKKTFTIHHESYIDPEPNDAIGALAEYDPSALVDPLTTKDNAAEWNKQVPAHSMGHEVGIGSPAGPFGEFYWRKNPDYAGGIGVWTRHGGLFRIVVGSHEGTPWPGMDGRQANTAGPTDLDFQFAQIPEVCCNIHRPVADNACSAKGWPGYGPTSGLSLELDGVAFIVNVTE